MRDANEHLTFGEIRQIVRRRAEPQGGRAATELEQHLAHCRFCSEIAEQYKTMMQRLDGFGTSGHRMSRESCPDHNAWLNLAAGLLSSREVSFYLHHAAECHACSAYLKDLVEVVGSADPAPPELQRDLKTAGDDWAKHVARQMAKQSERAARETPAFSVLVKPRFAIPAWTYAAAALLLIAAGLSIFLSTRPADPAKLLAQAYQQQRTIELRIPQAGYGPIRVERAQKPSQLNRPAAVLEALALIKRGLEKRPEDPDLLRAKAEADLLNWDYQPAIETLGHALRIQPNSFGLLVDLGTAHFERAEATSSPADYESGLQYLGDALRIQPNSPAALFNRAIIYERLYLYGRAIEDWELFLKVEKDPGWRSEAEKRLQDLRAQERRRGSRLLPERLSLAEFQSNVESDQAASIEEYLEVAERKILPKITSVSADENFRAAKALAERLKASHADPFLADLLQGAKQPGFHRAAMLLGQSSSANHSGHAEEAYAAAGQAAVIFRKSRNTPGVLVSLFEKTYALQFESRANACQELASESVGPAHKQNYAALEVQLLLEQAICSSMNREIGPAKVLTERALRTATDHGYQSLYLRGLTVLATLESETGNESRAWSAIHEGLGLYWKFGLPDVRGYSFYALLARMAVRLDHPNVQLSAASEALQFPNPDHMVEASERMRFAEAALRLGEAELAESSIKNAQRLFAAAPRTDSVHWHELEARLSLARVQALHQSNPNKVVMALLSSLTEVEHLSNRYIESQYYETLADLTIQSSDLTGSQRFLRSAIRIADDSLESLATWRERLAWMSQNRQPYLLMTELLFRSGNSESALDLWEHFRTAEGVTLSKADKADHAAPAGVLPTSQRSTDTRIITYAFGRDGLMIWVQYAGEMHSTYLSVPSQELRRAAENLIGECSRPDSDMSNLRADAQYLYRWLIQPVSPWLPPSGHIVVEPDGILGVVPLEALMDERGTYLGTRYRITVASSVRARQGADAFVVRDTDRVLIAASPTMADGSLQPPPGALEEARRVADRFVNPTLLAGGDVTTSNVARELRKSVLFHFAGHAGLNRGGAAMLLADGILGADEVSTRGGQHLGGLKLAMFSACGTAKPAEMSDSDSLVSEFLQAGAQNVVASRWNVDSLATAEFVDLFYKSVLSGSSVVDALQSTADAFRKKPGRAHPYYWAAFSAFAKA